MINQYHQSGINIPVDFDYLSELTMGDGDLQMELLSLFEMQIGEFLENARTATTSHENKRIAHTIKGAAKSIGAHNLVSLARGFEKNGEIDLSRLEDAFKDISECISNISRS